MSGSFKRACLIERSSLALNGAHLTPPYKVRWESKLVSCYAAVAIRSTLLAL